MSTESWIGRLIEASHAGHCGYRARVAPAAEPTILAAMALNRRPPQLELGNAPWLEGLNLLANLDDRRRAGESARRLLGWQGKEGNWLWRWKFRWFDRQVRFDPRKVGWGWTEQTISWVIPTAVAIVALERAVEAGAVSVRQAGARVILGKDMLEDRCCRGGGWNAGNPVVYGVALKPHLDTTAIALLALQDRTAGNVVTESVAWMRDHISRCRSAYSLAWALLALSTLAARKPALRQFATEARTRLERAMDPLPEDLTTIAVAILALDAFRRRRNSFLTRWT
jgi:hypothetical protein